MHPRSTAWRILNATTAAATILAGLVSMDHHAESRHEICEEHGELVHVENGRPDGQIQSADERPLVSGASDLAHGQHCSLEWSVPQSPQLGRLLGQNISTEQLSDPLRTERTTVRSIRRYLLAPKTSPPA